MTVSQIYENEHGYGLTSFATVVGKIIAQKLGAPDEQDDKKADNLHSPKRGSELQCSDPQSGNLNFEV